MTDASEPVGLIASYVQGFFWILPNLIVALVVLVVFILTAWLAGGAVVSVFRHRNRPDLGRLLGGFARWLVVVLGLLVVCAIVFPSVKPVDLLATLGIGSVAVGFAFKDILQNWLSGLLILYRQPFRRGDQIRSGDFEGTVEAIEPRATLIRTYDGQRVVIPNADIYTRAVTVRTAFETRRSQYDVGIGYGDDVEQACKVILGALGKSDAIVAEPAPEALPWELAPSTVVIRVRWWTKSRRDNVVQSQAQVIVALKRALTDAGIDLPYPTRMVMIHDQAKAGGAHQWGGSSG